MSKGMIKFRFENGRTDQWSEDFGPFEFVQLTYEDLRVGPDGESFATMNGNAEWTIDQDESGTVYSDVIIWSES